MAKKRPMLVPLLPVDRSRSARGSRRKGSSGEREAADKLTKIFYPSGGGKFVRSPHSGTWGHERAMVGDVVPVSINAGTNSEEIDRTWPFVWEVKRCARGKVAPLSWLTGEWGILETWMKETVEKLKNRPEAVPIVLWRTDHMEWCVVMRICDFKNPPPLFGPAPALCAILKDEAHELVMLSLKSFALFLKR